VIWLRRTRPELERPFRVPLVPVFPIIGALLCIYLMTQLSGATWWRSGSGWWSGSSSTPSTDTATRGCGAAT
jgi:amino acid transporter